MAIADYVNEVRDILENQGLGEKPSIRTCSATGNVATLTGDNLVQFDMAIGEAASIKPGHVLSAVAPSDATKAYCFYVTSVTDPVVVAVNGYKGAPKIADSSTDLNNALLYHQPAHLEHKIHSRVSEVLARFVYPQVFAIETASIATPNFVTGEDELPADVEKILSAFQVDARSSQIPIPFHVERNVHTAISSTGVLGTFDLYDSSPLYYTYKRRMVLGDEANYVGLVELVATGAAALLSGASVAGTENERAKRDATSGRVGSASQTLWRDFVAQRDSWSEDISRETVTHFYIER